MGNFNKGGKSFGGGRKFGGGGDRGGNRSFGGDRGGNRSFGGGRDRAEMHKATCSDCGKSCEVPFRPTGEKPVFCSECFGDKRGNSSDRGNDRNSKPRFDNKKSFQGGGDSQNYKAQFDALNTKLDKILKALDPNVSEELFGEEKKEEAPKYKEFKKAPKKEVDTVALKEALDKTSKKVSEKAPHSTGSGQAAKKVVAKKAPAKKVAAKKTPAKKVVAKKAPAKKVAAKKKK